MPQRTLPHQTPFVVQIRSQPLVLCLAYRQAPPLAICAQQGRLDCRHHNCGLYSTSQLWPCYLIHCSPSVVM